MVYKVKDNIKLSILKKYGYKFHRGNFTSTYDKLFNHIRVEKRRYTRDYIYYICIVDSHRQIYINVYSGGFGGVDIIKDYEKEEIDKYIKDLLDANLVEEVLNGE